MSDHRLKVYSNRRDRIGTRTEALLSTWRFARRLDREACVLWSEAKKNYHASLFFDLQALSDSFGSKGLKILTKRPKIPRTPVDISTFEGWPHQLDHSMITRIENDLDVGAHIDLRFADEAENEINAQKRELFLSLPWHPAIQENLTRALEWIGQRDFIAVHIRRGDIVHRLRSCISEFVRNQEGDSEVSPDKMASFEWEISKLLNFLVTRVTDDDSYCRAVEVLKPSDRRVVLFSDSSTETLADLLKQFRPLLMSSFATSLEEEQVACVEMLVLCHASAVVSTQSYFSKIARNYGVGQFVDARLTSGAEGTKAAFDMIVGDLLPKADWIREICSQMLDRRIAKESRKQTN